MGRGKWLFVAACLGTCVSDSQQISENHESLKQKWSDLRKALD